MYEVRSTRAARTARHPLPRRHVPGECRRRHSARTGARFRPAATRDSTGEHDPDMAGLTPLPTDARPEVRRPAPAGLMDDESDGEVADLDDLRGEEWKLDRLVGLLEILSACLGHRRHDRVGAACEQPRAALASADARPVGLPWPAQYARPAI